MKKRVEGISFSELKKGMIVAKDVEHNGSIIIKEGVVLNEYTIEKLQKVYIVGSVCVYAEESDISLERRKLIEFNDIETEFCEISSRLKNTFDKVFLNDDDYLNDIREFSKKYWKRVSFKI